MLSVPAGQVSSVHSTRHETRRPRRGMPERYWLVHPNGGRQLIDPRQFDLDHLARHAERIGGRLVVEDERPAAASTASAPASAPAPVPTALIVPPARAFEPPVSALGPLFRMRL